MEGSPSKGRVVVVVVVIFSSSSDPYHNCNATMPKKNCDFFAMKKQTHGRRRRSALSLTAGRRRRRIDKTSDRFATKFRFVENFHPVLSLLGFLATTTG